MLKSVSLQFRADRPESVKLNSVPSHTASAWITLRALSRRTRRVPALPFTPAIAVQSYQMSRIWFVIFGSDRRELNLIESSTSSSVNRYTTIAIKRSSCNKKRVLANDVDKRRGLHRTIDSEIHTRPTSWPYCVFTFTRHLPGARLLFTE